MSGWGRRLFFVAARATGEGLWVLALAGYVLHATVGEPFPLLAGLAAFLAASGLTRVSRGRGWRRVSILGIHLLGLLGCLAVAVPRGLDGPGWIPEGGDWKEWVWAAQTAFWIGVLWLKGIGFARNPATRERIGVQFDKGVTAFGLILLSGMLIEVKGDLSVAWNGTLPLFFLFFGLSVTAMGGSVPSGQDQGVAESLPGPGVGMTFVLLVLAVGTGVILLLMPLLMQAAHLGYDALKSTTSPMGPVLVRFLRFIFSHRSVSPEGEGRSGNSGSGDMISPGADVEAGPLAWVLGWGLAGLTGAALAGVTLIAVYYGLKLLFARTRTSPSETRRTLSLWEWIRSRLHLLQGLRPGAWLRKWSDPGPIRLYGRLIRWGGRSGLPHHPGETALEFGGRLSQRFAGLADPIDRIVDLANQEAYGDVPPGPEARATGRLAWRRLRSPRHWPSRMRVLLLPVRPSWTSRETGAPHSGAPRRPRAERM